MIAVLDASAAMEIVNGKRDSDAFLKALAVCEKVIAPGLFLIEVASALKKYVSAGMLDKLVVAELLSQADSLITVTVETREIIVEAMSEAIRLNHSVYDMLYFTLARRNGAALITLDKKLNKLAAREGITILVDIPVELLG
ncbi:hypothetical protein FACS1894104_1200 [Actinomycetota bacterium]|nr:hypothetical protein FACS1894104_1200 [Actinomycetota bacterium]